MSLLTKMSLTIAMAILSSNVTLAQKSGFYASVGGGLAGNSSHALALNGTLKNKLFVFSTRYLKTEEIRINIINLWEPHARPPLRSASDIAFLAGVTSKYNNHASATFEIGIGIATIVKPLEYHFADYSYGMGLTYDKSIKSTTGLAFQSQLYWRRLGLVIMGNINSLSSFGAGLLSFRVGRCN